MSKRLHFILVKYTTLVVILSLNIAKTGFSSLLLANFLHKPERQHSLRSFFLGIGGWEMEWDEGGGVKRDVYMCLCIHACMCARACLSAIAHMCTCMLVFRECKNKFRHFYISHFLHCFGI